MNVPDFISCVVGFFIGHLIGNRGRLRMRTVADVVSMAFCFALTVLVVRLVRSLTGHNPAP